MYQAIYKCKLCGEIETENVDDNEFDMKYGTSHDLDRWNGKGRNYKHPLKTLFKSHLCNDGSIGTVELIGFKRAGD